MRRGKLIREIRSKLLEAIDTESIDWVRLALVAEITQTHSELTGFAYDIDGNPEPVIASSSAVFKLLQELRVTMASAEHGPLWRSTVIRIERDTGEINFEFQYDSPGRWTKWPHEA